MRRARFRDPGGVERTGDWTDRGIECSGRVYDPTEVDVLPPTEPDKIIGVSTNHFELLEAYPDLIEELPDRPRLFTKTPNTLSGHGDAVELLPDRRIEFEAELGIVVGEQCRHVPASEAYSVVEGFTCVNDITNQTDDDYYGVRFKSFDNAAVVGPVVVPPERVPDDARIQLRCNGEVRQDSDRAGLKFDVPEIIEEITTYITLEPGDVIPMGTPPGVGELEDGDHVEIEIEGIGTLEHDVVAPP